MKLCRKFSSCGYSFIFVCLVLHPQIAKSAEIQVPGSFEMTCNMTSNCQLGLVCQLNKCVCDSSHIFDRIRKVCKKICHGSQDGLMIHANSDHQYTQYKNRYTNCTYVAGNLEITNLKGSYDLGFLNNIEEVDGYVLVLNIYSNYLNLTHLHIIRGKTLFEFKNITYSLYVALNHNDANVPNDSQGLLELQFIGLSEIARGRIYFNDNKHLCFVDTIRWDDINPTTSQPVTIVPQNYSQQCPPCHNKCYNDRTKKSHCWGSGPYMCQKLNYVKEVCHESCDGRCFGQQQNECCHPECAAGCTGPKKTECLSCKNFYNDGQCHAFCPNMKIYDQYLMKWVNNPDGRYSFQSLCVRDCPSYLVKDKDACVLKCPNGTRAKQEDNVCTECPDKICPKHCDGVEAHEFITSKNIGSFRGCTIVDKNVKILNVTFQDDDHEQTSGLNISDLAILKDIREIYGYLAIQQTPAEVKDLSFLSGLEIIYGRSLSQGRLAINILETALEYLGLTSLRQIKNGHVFISLNSHLCYIDNLDMNPLFLQPNQRMINWHNTGENITSCDERGLKCHPQCSRYGCWGPGPDKCMLCKNVRIHQNNTCLGSCADIPMLYDAGNHICKQCHEQCALGCSGPGPDKCFTCKYVKLLGQNNTFECMSKCPSQQQNQPFLYADENKVCRSCDLSCAVGCTGPLADVKQGGCMTCNLAINRTHENGTVHCLQLDHSDACPDGYYEQQYKSDVLHPLNKKPVCQPCDYLCLSCSSPGVTNCPKCRYFRHEVISHYGTCVDSCPQFTYPTTDNVCLSCHDQCYLGCTGPNYTDCTNCMNFKVIINADNSSFLCVDKCPEHLMFLVEDTNPAKRTRTVCANEDHPDVRAEASQSNDAEREIILVITLPVTAVIIAIVILISVYFWRQRARSKENTIKLTARMTGVEPEEPLTLTDVKPDLSTLRLVKESQLRRGGIIGSGAFGTVYKGFWIPEGENVKIPVAIKVLQDGTSPNLNQDLLEEARVMASVEHPCCIRILAVCMTSQMMLITQLLPLGCLLDYIRKHKDNTGSKSLLYWCTQIARGMAYLEERGIVHRDLAARNVLVQSAGQVKITDFGLAKLLDYNEEQYQGAGGKMPIKWLALECIKHRIFTHKSDVWSYGVTLWELFTYGEKPYDTVRAREVPDLLEKGERLPQPAICTIDVYMIMIKCWMLDYNSRPSFAELAEEFSKMAQDPGRYLVIQGDKLMWLPTYTYNKDDLERYLSVTGDGPEEVVEADDYLQPTPQTPLSAENDIKSPHAANQPMAIREKRYGHLESAAAARKQNNGQHGDSSNGRYSSDPVKYTHNRDDVDNGNVLGVPELANGDVQHFTIMPNVTENKGYTLQLPTDEDDYLEPKSVNPKAYVDLTNEYYLNENQLSKKSDSAKESYCSSEPASSAFENQEYFDTYPRDGVLQRQLDPERNVGAKSKVSCELLTNYYNDFDSDFDREDDRQRCNDIQNSLSNSDVKCHMEVQPLLSNSNCSNGDTML